MPSPVIDEIRAGFESGSVIPYLGPGMLALLGDEYSLPAAPEELAGRLTAKSSVPHKIRWNLTAAAQFIENFKHRKTVKTAMLEAFQSAAPATDLHKLLAAIPALPLVVHAWYDDLPQKGLATRASWGVVQGVSQAENIGIWVRYYNSLGNTVPVAESAKWETLLYQPLGSVSPAGNFLVSDSDFVEVLTEIDIQTPIPQPVQQIRTGRHFLFLGCRFSTQLERIFARQIMKRSSARHWVVLPEEPTRNELRFLAEQGIERIGMPLTGFREELEQAFAREAERQLVGG